jgi:hypothetical protein
MKRKKKQEKGKGNFETNKKTKLISCPRPWLRIRPSPAFLFLSLTHVLTPSLSLSLYGKWALLVGFSFQETRSHAHSRLFSISHSMRSAPSPLVGTPSGSACLPATVPSHATDPHPVHAATHASARPESRPFLLSG